MKETDILRLRGRGDERDHAAHIRLGEDSRRILRIEQHDVGAGRLQARQAFVQKRGVRRHCFVAQQRIRTNLPQHQIGFFGNDGGVEAREHARDFVAVDAAVQHRDGMSRKSAGQIVRQAARIRGGRGACAGPVGRRGAERHNFDRLAAGEEPRSPRQRAIKAYLLERQRARGWPRDRAGGWHRGGNSDRDRHLRLRRKQCN